MEATTPSASVRRVPTGRGDPNPTGVFVVTAPDEPDVVVRLTPGTAKRWRCGACQYRSATTDCPHTFAVGIYLAETELGLTRLPDLEAAHA